MHSNTAELKQIPVDKLIIHDDDNARVNLVNLKELEASISQHGVVSPITVAKTEDGGYRVVAGFRRAHAVTNLKLKLVPAMVRDEERDEELLIQLIENMDRENWTAYETGLQLKRIVDTCELNRDELAKRLNKSNAWVSNYLGLFDFPEEVQAMAKEDRLGVTHLRKLHAKLKHLDEKGITRMAKEVEGLNQERMDDYFTKWDEKHSDKPAKKAAVKAVDEVEVEVEEPEVEAKGARLLRAREEILDTLEELKAQAEGADEEELRGKLLGRAEALMWVLGDDTVELT